MIVDDFIPSFGPLQQYAQSIEYGGIVNPADGILYPDVTDKIPEFIYDQVQDAIERAMGRDVTINTMFMRLTSRQTFGAPHQAHNDSVMGSFTLLLYLNDGPGGTSFVTHIETGMDAQPETQEQFEAWQRDTNVPEAWEITEMVNMKENRGNIIEAVRMHRAEPVGGFGEDATDGRIVLTAFFE